MNNTFALSSSFKLGLRLILLISALVFGVFTSNSYGAVETYQFNSELERKRYSTFIDELRCPKCQNQNLAGSDSPIASDLRKELHRMVQSGQSDTEIIDFMVSRYGEFVLYRPRMTLKTLVLWLAPVTFLILGMAWAIWVVRKHKQQKQRQPLTTHENQQISDLLAAKAETLTPRQQQNIALYQNRLTELEAQKNTSELTDGEYQTLALEAQRNMLADLALPDSPQSAQPQSESDAKPKRLLMAFILLCFGALAVLGLYSQLGAAPDLVIHQKIKDFYALREQLTDQGQLSNQDKLLKAQTELVVLMEKRLASAPHKLDYAVILAQIYSQKSEYLKAAEYYSMLAKAKPEDATIQAQLAQSLYFAHNRKLTPAVAKAMDKTLALDAKNPIVLGLQGIHFFTQKQYRAALNAWETLLTVLPPNSPQANMIERGIMQAQLKLAVSEPAKSAPEPQSETKTKPVENQGKQIRVSVSLPPKVLTAKGVTPNTKVFILAKALVGPPMPLAIYRLNLSDFPATVVLDDSTAMMESMKLSAFDEVEVIVRVSLSGETKAQPGDFEARSGKITLSDKPVSIALSPDTVIP